MYVSSYYRPPNDNMEKFRELETSFANLSETVKKKPIILGGISTCQTSHGQRK